MNGIIHSAMDLSEQSLNNMKTEEFKSVPRAKADVSVSMAEVFGREPLDFALFFSSLVAFIHNVSKAIMPRDALSVTHLRKNLIRHGIVRSK
ncbi:KR domain-containing protein [Bacillus velezensis]|nr:KR domain-containing protein [Bacillus velezensis]